MGKLNIFTELHYNDFKIIDDVFYTISLMIHSILGLLILILAYKMYQKVKFSEQVFSKRNYYFAFRINLFLLSGLVILISFIITEYIGITIINLYFILLFLSYGSLYWKDDKENIFSDFVMIISDFLLIMLIIFQQTNNEAVETNLLATLSIFVILAFYLIIQVSINMTESVNLFIKSKYQKSFYYQSIINSSLTLSFLLYLIGALADIFWLFVLGRLMIILTIFYLLKHAVINLESNFLKNSKKEG